MVAGVEPSDEEAVAAAVSAAEGVIFSRFSKSEVRDLDVTVHFAAGRLEVDVYLNVDDEAADQVADDAARAAVDAVDELFA
jgi:hypothetical protein